MYRHNFIKSVIVKMNCNHMPNFIGWFVLRKMLFIFLFPLHTSNPGLRLLRHPVRFDNFLQGLIISPLIQLTAVQILFRLLREIHLIDRYRPSHAHSHILVVTLNPVKSCESRLQIFCAHKMTQQHDNRKTDLIGFL